MSKNTTDEKVDTFCIPSEISSVLKSFGFTQTKVNCFEVITPQSGQLYRLIAHSTAGYYQLTVENYGAGEYLGQQIVFQGYMITKPTELEFLFNSNYLTRFLRFQAELLANTNKEN